MLSKQTTDQIRKEAERVAWSGTQNDYTDGVLKGYISAATAWAVWKEKADGYEKALKEIQNSVNNRLSYSIATKALEQFK